MIRRANPSAMADLPTPGSPINKGLFFFLRLKICETRSIYFSRPTTGSNFSCSASRVTSRPKLSKTGVLVFLLVLDSEVGMKGFSFSSPSFFYSGKEEEAERSS